ncbi:MAG: hypothetical protein HYZ34_12780, partial [Ignavibacteriae bacterium]|nr:hypothetical protein [Ignavibacteriota bacterium]
CSFAQVKAKVNLIGGDNVPQLKQKFQQTLETLLLEMNRLSKGTGDLKTIKPMFTNDAFAVFERFVLANKAYTARKLYEPQLVERERGAYYDVRSISVKVNLGETEASDVQNLIFMFSKEGSITSVRAVIPNYDMASVLEDGTSSIDSTTRIKILDFLERFRLAYNSKDIEFLEKVYSDEALIIVGTVLKEKQNADDMLRGSSLSKDKVKFIQMSKRAYIDGLKERAFKSNSFLSVRFDEIKIIRHEKIPQIYGVSCKQEWKSSNYSDNGFLFLMVDYQNPDTPVVHVRSWQPKPFDDGSYVDLYDFDIVEYK